jgi:hypothetical protein
MANLLIVRCGRSWGREVGMVAALAWLLIPFLAAIGAAVWASWVARDSTTRDVAELAGYAKFREAMERPDFGSGPLQPAASSGRSPDGPAPAVD